eukprot:scaffold93526_cov35-Attheya_sp.AAC.1
MFNVVFVLPATRPPVVCAGRRKADSFIPHAGMKRARTGTGQIKTNGNKPLGLRAPKTIRQANNNPGLTT